MLTRSKLTVRAKCHTFEQKYDLVIEECDEKASGQNSLNLISVKHFYSFIFSHLHTGAMYCRLMS